jgi:hypothetical protein
MWGPHVGERKREELRVPFRGEVSGLRVGWFGGFWAGPVPGSAQWLPFSPFFLFKLFSFLFSGLSYNFFILAPNELKPNSKFF